MSSTLRFLLPGVLASLAACDSTAPPPPAPRPAGPPPPAASRPAPERPDIPQTVARVALVSGSVSFSRGDDPDDWAPVDPNVPMTLGDRLWTGEDGRVELQIHGGNLARLAARTDLQALNLTDDVKQFSLALGTASFSIRRLGDDEVFEVDTPNAAVTLERPGDYRVDVDPDGNSRIQVRRGRAVAASAGSQATLSAGEELDVDGIDAPRSAVVALPEPDGWDAWVEERDQRLARARSYAYVSADVAGVEDLDRYGRWQQIPEYGWAWTPVGVEVGWAPYVSGRWIWQDPWGWTWVAAEPWGWAPYHYGRWSFWSGGWYWVPVGPAVRAVAYSPALVAFVGGSGGYVGWFPLAPRDPFYPWWRPAPAVAVTHVTYVNRTYVTVVNQTTFVSGGLVTRGVVRDRTVIRTIEAGPVLRGPVPVVPTRSSLRMTTREAPAPRPPAAASRQVVTRVAPAPAPPRFDVKAPVIRERGGAPVAPSDAARLSASGPATASRARPTPAGGAPTTSAPRDSRPVPAAPAPRVTSPPEARPTAIGRPPAREPYARTTPRGVVSPRPTPPAAGGERVQAPPAVRERPQPAERVAPEPRNEKGASRPAPRPTATKPPKKADKKPEKQS